MPGPVLSSLVPSPSDLIHSVSMSTVHPLLVSLSTIKMVKRNVIFGSR